VVASERVYGLGDLVYFGFVDVLDQYVDDSVHRTLQHKARYQIRQTLVIVRVKALPRIQLIKPDTSIVHELGERLDILLHLFVELLKALDFCLVLGLFGLEEYGAFFNISSLPFDEIEKALTEILYDAH
jgi:hypothetical protein